MSNLGRIYEFLSQTTAVPLPLAAMVESLGLRRGLAGAKSDEPALLREFRRCPTAMSVISLPAVHAE